MLRLLLSVSCLIVLAGVAAQARSHNVRLRPTPQKFRTFYAHGDERIPAAIRARLDEPQQTARAGKNVWRVEADALVRESAPRARLSFEAHLPIGGLRVIAVAGDGAVWAGGDEGLIRYDERARGWDRWQYFGGRRYLPSDDVTALAAGRSNSIWVRTAAGVSHIELRPLTLLRKAALFEERLARRHKRHDLVADSEFREPGNPATSHQYPNDNDGLWTAIYVAAEAFRYAVTGDRAAFDAARRSVEAMMRLEEITGRPGFPARSFRHRDEPRHRDGIWHFTPDGEWEWKADTSSDEIVGHFFAYAVAFDLLDDRELRNRLRRVVARIADHLIEHNYNLTDLHGRPTRWGRYGPDYFQTAEGREEMALASIELLSHLKVAHHVTGDERYAREYRKLIREHHYHTNVTTYLKYRREINYSDEELALLPYYHLFMYETDGALRRIYRAGLDQWWQNIRRERNPLWTFIYATANSHKSVSFEAAVATLYRIPIDLTKWSVRNSHRRDAPRDPAPDRFGRLQTTRLLAPDERRVMKWNSNPFQLDDDSGGRGEDDGAFFLLPYWMGRYHKFIIGE